MHLGDPPIWDHFHGQHDQSLQILMGSKSQWSWVTFFTSLILVSLDMLLLVHWRLFCKTVWYSMAPWLKIGYRKQQNRWNNFANVHLTKFRSRNFQRTNWDGSQKKYPELASSGSDCHVCLAWLEDLLELHAVDAYRPIAVLIWTGNQICRILYAADWFLTTDEQRSVKALGNTFLNQYFQLASTAIRTRKFMWKVLPKAHMFDHCIDSPRKVNISRYSTWMDKDFLRKITKVICLTSSKTAMVRVLQRWLLGMPGYLSKTKTL